MATSKKTTKAAADKAPAKKAAPAKAAPATKPASAKKAPAKAEPKQKPTPKATPKPEPKAKATPAKAKAAPKTEPKAPAKAKAATKTESKAPAKAKAAPKPEPKAPAKTKTAPKPEPKATAKVKAAPKPEPKAPAKAKAAPKPEPKEEKPVEVKEKAPKATKPKAPKTPKAPKPAKPGKETLTAEEKAHLAKYKATLALLKADPEWPAFLAEQKELLLQMRDKLLPNMHNVTRDHLRSGASNVSSASGQHIGDAGSEAEVRDLTIRLLDKDREQIFEIDAALERIRMGNYGICEISLDPIPKKRLQVRPACRLTVKCQEEYEKKYGSYANYRAQNSDNVGFSGLQNAMESVISLDETEE